MNNVYMYRLHAPRPDFSTGMTPDEAEIMRQHAGFWAGLMAEGKVLVFTPVQDPVGDWGMAIVLADDFQTVDGYSRSDPAVLSGMMTHSVLALPFAITPDRIAAVSEGF